MNSLQSDINLAKAQIQQFKDSDFFSEAEKERLIAKAQTKLNELLELENNVNKSVDANTQ
jgi:hypothetical protein